MNNKTLKRLSWTSAVLMLSLSSTWAQTIVPSTFQTIPIDGSFNGWANVPLAYTAAQGPANAIQYSNVWICNDQNNLYIRFTLYTSRPDAFANPYDNLFFDADDNSATGYQVGGIGSDMLIQYGAAYQEINSFNNGQLSGLGWNIAGSSDGLDFELSLSLAVKNLSGNPVFGNQTIAILLEGQNTGWANVEFVPPSGGLIYTLASAPAPASATVVTLANTAWEVNGSGSNLGTNWLGQNYNDAGAGWSSGEGLFGYTSWPASYPAAINTPLSSGANTYYFRTHFQWTNALTNVAFLVTNYLSDGAVYYLNGHEVARVRMPAGPVTYSTQASATNSTVGNPDIFGISAASLQTNDNILEVEVHQAASSANDMVFGLSLTTNTPVTLSTGPTNQIVLEGQPATFRVGAVGSAPLQYQWFFGGTAIYGATNSSYNIASAVLADSGSYYVQVSNLASSSNSAAATLTVLSDTIPPNIVGISALGSNEIIVTFSKPVAPATATNPALYSVTGGATVLSASVNPINADQVILITGGDALSLGTVYSVTVNGVTDLFGNRAAVTAQVVRSIAMDGSLADWDGITPIYTNAPQYPGAADFGAIYVYNDANYYYFMVMLWSDLPSQYGQFPDNDNLFFNTDNIQTNGYSVDGMGSELLLQDTVAYPEKLGTFNDGTGITGIGWSCWQMAGTTNYYEFQLSRSATFSDTGAPVFSTNILNFIFVGQNGGWVPLNYAPPSGYISYTNVASVTPAALPLGTLAISPLAGARAAVTWFPPGVLQTATSLTGPWTTVSGAASPYVISAPAGPAYFRLAQ